MRRDIISPVGAKQWHVQDTLSKDYFIVSRVNAFMSGWECLVFTADGDGKVTDWMDIAGGRDMSHEGAVEDLLEFLRERDERRETKAAQPNP